MYDLERPINVEFCSVLSLWYHFIMTVTKYEFKTFISACGYCRFVVIERCGDVHKLVVVCTCTRRSFILGF